MVLMIDVSSIRAGDERQADELVARYLAFRDRIKKCRMPLVVAVYKRQQEWVIEDLERLGVFIHEV